MPKLFEILGWTALLGFFQYVASTTNNLAVWTIYFVSFLGMLIYIQVYIYSSLLVKYKSKRTLISLILGLVLAVSIWHLLNTILDELASASVN